MLSATLLAAGLPLCSLVPETCLVFERLLREAGEKLLVLARSASADPLRLAKAAREEFAVFFW